VTESDPPSLYPDHVATRLRAPTRPLVTLPETLTELTGPVHGDGAVEPPDSDLTRQHAGEPLGERIVVSGRVLGGTDAEGRYAFVTVKPGPVPGPDGRLQAPHVALAVLARGLLKHVTRVYFPDEQAANAADPVLSAIVDADERATLVAVPEDGGLRFDVRLQGDRQTVFFAAG
jgi:protocatechuate 3,4-dioxygenase alpha subunit